MKKISILIILTGFVFANCTKKREEKFPAPLELFMLNSAQTYEIVKAPKSGAQMLGKVTNKDKVMAVGSIVLVEKNGDQKYLQVQCPSSITCEKEGGYIFLGMAKISGCKECSDATGTDLTGILLESSAVEKAVQTRDWIQNWKSCVPNILQSIQFSKSSKRTPKVQERTGRTML